MGSRAGFRRRHGLILGGVGSTILRSDLATSNEQFQIAQDKYVHSILGPICQDHSTGRSATICSCSLGQVMLVRMLRLLRLARAVRTGAPIDRHARFGCPGENIEQRDGDTRVIVIEVKI